MLRAGRVCRLTPWLLSCALVLAACSQGGVVKAPEAISIRITLGDDFNLQLITGMKILLDSVPDGGVSLGLPAIPEEAHTISGVQFSTQATDDDGDGENEYIVRFPASPFVSRTFEFPLFPSSGDSAPFLVRVQLQGRTGLLADVQADKDDLGEPIRFRAGVRRTVSLTIACNPDFTCLGPNRPPAFGALSFESGTVVAAGELVAFSVIATDPDGDTPFIRALGMGRAVADGGVEERSLASFGATFDEGTRIFRWIPREQDALDIFPTPYVVRFRAEDSGGLSAFLLVTIQVVTANRAPVFGEVRPQTPDEGDTVSFSIPVTDFDNDEITVTSDHAQSLSRPGRPPPDARLDRLVPDGGGAATWRFTWNTQQGEGQIEAYRVTFTATDQKHPPVSLFVDITVNDLPPLSNGSPCATNDLCSSNQCVDNVCCEVPACAAGSVCTSPLGQCRKLPGQPCANAAECQTSFCVEGTCCRTSFCFTGLTCANPAGECKKKNGSACTIVDECASGFCVTGTCCQSECALAPVSRTCANSIGLCARIRGITCTDSAQCQPGLTCVDGVCCTSPSCPACFGCNLAGREGDCRPREEEDPRGECAGTGPCKQICRAGACVFPGGERSCDDGDPCTTQDSCTSDGRCAGNPWAVENPTPSIHFSDLVVLPSGSLLAASRAGPVYRHDGRSWTLEDTGTAQPVRSFSALAEDDVFAVGDRVFLRLQGGVWKSQPVNALLAGVWAGAVNLAFAVGKEPGSERPVIYEYNGVRWSQVLPGIGELHAVSGFRDPATNRFLAAAVGLALNLDGSRAPWILMNDGVTTCGDLRWCRHPLALPPGLAAQTIALRSVAVASLEEAAAVGDQSLYAEFKGGQWRTRCMGTDGAPLLCPDNPPAAPTLTSITRSSDGFFLVVRDNQILRGKNDVWSAPLTLPAGTRADRISALTGDDFRLADADGGLSRFIGSFSSLVTSVTASNLSGVWISATGTAYAVGESSTFVRRVPDGGWQSVGGPGGTHQLTAVFGTSDNRIHASTAGGAVFTYSDGGWGCPEQQEAGLTTIWEVPPDAGTLGPVTGKATRQFRRGTQNATCALWGSAARPALGIWGPPQPSATPRYYATTGAGVQAYQFSGGIWSPSGAEEPVAQGRAVWGTSNTNVWAVGNEIKRFNGTSWSTAGPSGYNLCALNGVGTGMIAIGGGCAGSSTNTALYYDGANWTPDRLLTTVGVTGVDANPMTRQFFAVGASGVILRRCPIPGTNP
jgi:hypothetical protein